MAESTDFLSAMRDYIADQMIDVNTCIQGEIVSYAGGLATVRPLGSKRYKDGDVLEFPTISDVPVRWPVFAGGKAGFKGKVGAGDKCMLIFSQQPFDGTDDLRRFDLSDAYAVMVDNSQAGQGGNNEDLIMYFGSAYIKLTEGGKLEINAPLGTEVIAPKNLFTGAISGQGGLSVAGVHPETGKPSSVQGDFVVTGGNVIADGVGLKTHKHSGVTAGGSNTGNPIP